MSKFVSERKYLGRFCIATIDKNQRRYRIADGETPKLLNR